MPTKTYAKPAANAAAVTKLNTWLKASGIDTQPGTNGVDVIVTRDGKTVKVSVAIDGVQAANDALAVLAKDVTSPKAGVAMAAFHRVTEAVGAGKPDPLSLRGEAPTKKLHYSDNFELVSMRHKEFRRVPNPAAQDLKEYEQMLMRACRRFLAKNWVICQRNGVEVQDLLTYAQVWACNYLGLFKVENPTNNDNVRKMSAYVRQRFGEFASMLVKKERNCIPDSETASIATFGKPNAANRDAKHSRGYSFSDDEIDFEEYTEQTLSEDVFDEGLHDMTIEIEPVNTHAEIAAEEERERKVSDAKRRVWAQKALAQYLTNLPHDQMVEKLTEACNNKHICPDAIMEARRQLRIHRHGCPECRASSSK